MLAIEVSDTSLRYDREIKVPLFARHGVPEVWIVDLPHNRLLVYLEPRDVEYRQHRVVEQPGTMPVTMLPGLSVDLSAVFG